MYCAPKQLDSVSIVGLKMFKTQVASHIDIIHESLASGYAQGAKNQLNYMLQVPSEKLKK